MYLSLAQNIDQVTGDSRKIQSENKSGTHDYVNYWAKILNVPLYTWPSWHPAINGRDFLK